MKVGSQGAEVRACVDSKDPRRLSVDEPSQIHILKRHLWQSCEEWMSKAGRQEAGRGAQ